MRLALFADVHSNLEAISACLAHARAEGAARFAFLGDLVGYGADPVAVLELVMRLAGEGAAVVCGNHDVAVLAGKSDTMHAAAEEAVAWTRAQLSPGHLAFLASLPFTIRDGDALLVHASPELPEEFIYVTDPYRAEKALEAAPPDVRWVFCGHVHEPVLYYTGAAQRPVPFHPTPGVPIPVPAHRRWLAIVGSAGQPRDGNTAACYAMMDLARGALTFHRVPYDHGAAAAKIRAAGLPERLAHRLERGE